MKSCLIRTMLSAWNNIADKKASLEKIKRNLNVPLCVSTNCNCHRILTSQWSINCFRWCGVHLFVRSLESIAQLTPNVYFTCRSIIKGWSASSRHIISVYPAHCRLYKRQTDVSTFSNGLEGDQLKIAKILPIYYLQISKLTTRWKI